MNQPCHRPNRAVSTFAKGISYCTDILILFIQNIDSNLIEIHILCKYSFLKILFNSNPKYEPLTLVFS